MTTEIDIKYCQSCIERGFNPPNIATREYQVGVYYCDECFDAVLQNLTNIAPASVIQEKVANRVKENTGPVLDFLYEQFLIPPELRFDSVDTVCRNYEKLFNFHAPAVINRSLDSLTEEHEQLSMSLFIIKYRMEPLKMAIDKAKEERRKEKNLTGYQDSKETYAKGKPPKNKDTDIERAAKKMGISVEMYLAMRQKARDMEFNKMAGNCPECGGAMPCKEHR
jgi:hypothetical protein